MILNLKFSRTKGDISVQALVAIVIGIIVLAVVVYLMLFYSKESSFDCRLCSSKFTEWCQKCLSESTNWNRSISGLNWVNDVPKSDELKECLSECTNIDPSDDCPALFEECKKYIFIPNFTAS